MHIGATPKERISREMAMEETDLQILFWKVTSRIFRGVNSVGGLADRAVPAGGDWRGV